MRLLIIAVLCACAVAVAGDVAHLKAKTRLVGQLKHKRGVLSPVPTFKLGHDIPLVSHSVVKPFVVTYPPTAAVAAVKVPLAHPLVHRYPVPVGHKVPVPHPHYGLKFPHHHPKTFVLPKPDQHFHHHHHHVAPRPAVPVIPAPAVPVPVPATPVVPVAQPSGTINQPIPVPSPPVFLQPSPIVPAQPVPVAPPPLQILPPHHAHFSPVFPSAPSPVPILPAPVYPVAPQYLIRPGNAIQTSLFATYPRYPLVNYQQLFPLTAPAAPAVGQVLLDRPQVPHFHIGQEVLQQPTPTVAVGPTPTLLHSPPSLLHPTPSLLHPTQATVPQPGVHLHPTQAVPLEHDGWSPVPAQHDLASHAHTEAHFPQSPDPHIHSGHQFTQEQGTQVYEHHTNEQQYHDYQHELQHHIQQQIDQAQFEQNLNNQHQLSQEYGAPQISQDFGHSDQEYSHHGHEYAQQGQDFGAHQQLGQEYGPPHQEVEGRSSEGEEDTQRYHNHIPLGLQPPINRPLEHFR